MQIAPMVTQGKIIINKPDVKNHYLMRIELSSSFPSPIPGQFVMIREKNLQASLLARPMSIYSFERQQNCTFLEIFYRRAGEGTKKLSFLEAGSEIIILGPLGHGYSINQDCKHMILISGGIGISPLTFLAAHLSDVSRITPIEITAYIGAQQKDSLAGLDRLSSYCPDIRICTDDGSMGYHGLVTDLFEREISRFSINDSNIYACGPRGMMKRLAELLRDFPFLCQVSVEEKMACGLGACLGCAVPVKTSAGNVDYRRVCKDGPVFDIHQVIWQ
jgi:dihydroorotate dehydrogenase electron transfer subunit